MRRSIGPPFRGRSRAIQAVWIGSISDLTPPLFFPLLVLSRHQEVAPPALASLNSLTALAFTVSQRAKLMPDSDCDTGLSRWQCSRNY